MNTHTYTQTHTNLMQGEGSFIIAISNHLLHTCKKKKNPNISKTKHTRSCRIFKPYTCFHLLYRVKGQLDKTHALDSNTLPNIFSQNSNYPPHPIPPNPSSILQLICDDTGAQNSSHSKSPFNPKPYQNDSTILTIYIEYSEDVTIYTIWL